MTGPAQWQVQSNDRASSVTGAEGHVIRVMIADDHPIFREGLESLLRTQGDFQVVGIAETGLQAVETARQVRPDVILMDLRMPDLGGVGATTALHAQMPEVKVLVLTTYDSDADILRAIEAGAVGYLLKDVPYQELFTAIRAIARGERRLAPSMLSSVVAERLIRRAVQHPRSALSALTPREQDVLEWIAQGVSNKRIARELGVGEATVKSHLLRVYEKLGVQGRTAAVLRAMEQGLLRPVGD